jgi:hypothetical protein
VKVDLTAIRIRAFRAVTAPNLEYLTRRVIRWYSKTFSTPIDRVEELPLEDIFQAYYEDHYESLDPDGREAECEDLLTTDEQRLQQILSEEAAEAEMFEMARIVAAEEAQKKARPKSGPKSEEQITAMTHPVPGLLKEIKESRESDLPVSKPLPPAIEMKFMEESDLQAEIARFESLADGRKP